MAAKTAATAANSLPKSTGKWWRGKADEEEENERARGEGTGKFVGMVSRAVTHTHAPTQAASPLLSIILGRFHFPRPLQPFMHTPPPTHSLASSFFSASSPASSCFSQKHARVWLCVNSFVIHMWLRVCALALFKYAPQCGFDLN